MISGCFLWGSYLVERDRRVHLADKDERSSESDESCEDKEADGNDERVAKVEQSRDEVSYFEAREEVKDCKEVKVDGRRARCQE